MPSTTKRRSSSSTTSSTSSSNSVRRRAIVRWGLVAGWASLIFTFSSGWFAGEHTGSVLVPLLAWLLPDASPETLGFLHAALRKTAHVVEYLILAVLVVRALRLTRPADVGTALTAWLACALFAASDELHQVFVPGRVGAAADVAVDAVGAALGALVAVAAYRWRDDAGGEPPAPDGARRRKLRLRGAA